MQHTLPIQDHGESFRGYPDHGVPLIPFKEGNNHGHSEPDQHYQRYPGSGNTAGSGAGLVTGAPFLLGKIIRHHVHVVNKVGIPYPQPVPVEVVRNIPIRVPEEVSVPVYKPYKVPVHVNVPVPIYKDVPVPVERKVPVQVKVIHQKRIEIPYKVYHPKPFPIPIWQKVPVPVPKPVIVKRPVPVAVHLRLVPLETHADEHPHGHHNPHQDEHSHHHHIHHY